jgi:hypothetical protein
MSSVRATPPLICWKKLQGAGRYPLIIKAQRIIFTTLCMSEFSCGPSSGWTYTVNGESPDKGCSQYVLHDGDSVEFYYVCDYTKEAVK